MFGIFRETLQNRHFDMCFDIFQENPCYTRVVRLREYIRGNTANAGSSWVVETCLRGRRYIYLVWTLAGGENWRRTHFGFIMNRAFTRLLLGFSPHYLALPRLQDSFTRLHSIHPTTWIFTKLLSSHPTFGLLSRLLALTKPLG